MAGALTFRVEDDKVRQTLTQAESTLKQGTGPLQFALRAAAHRYLAFIRERFLRASGGDGTWPPLAESTKLRKVRKLRGHYLAAMIRTTGAKTRAAGLQILANTFDFPILRETDRLWDSLQDNASEQVIGLRPDGFDVTIDVPYAEHHQSPAIPGRPPQREIFVEPDEQTLGDMREEIAIGAAMALRS